MNIYIFHLIAKPCYIQVETKNIYTIVSTTACNVSSMAKDMDLDTLQIIL